MSNRTQISPKKPASGQAIARLTPLADVLAMLEKLSEPVVPRVLDRDEALGCVIAVDVVAHAQPANPIAVIDGFAVTASELIDAGGYAPVALSTPPRRVETGDELPADADAVAPYDFIVERGARHEAVGSVAPGENVLAAGADVDAAKPLRRAGERLRAVDLAILMAAGVAQVSVRQPKIWIVAAREDLRLAPPLQMIARDCATLGCEAIVRNGSDPEDALRQNVDAVVIVGGTGTGARDETIAQIARAGRVVAHGVAISPGETSALGEVRDMRVLAVPGRLDAALASWLTLGRALTGRLSGTNEPQPTFPCRLARKIASSLGVTEFIPVFCEDGRAVPLASRTLPLSVLARANGWLLVPAASEGYAEGTMIDVRPWP